jgi:hypothetical protein
VAGEKTVIEVMAALAGIQTAVKLVKAAANTAKDLESLGPVLGQLFSAKSAATTVVHQSKQGAFKGSAMGQAIELELALESAKQLEESIKMLFFSSNKMDVWGRIVARAAAIDKEAAHDARRAKEAKARKDKEMDELITLLLMLLVVVTVLGATGWFVYEAMQQCAGKCGFQQ